MNKKQFLLKQLLFLGFFSFSSFFNPGLLATNGEILDVQDDARLTGCGYGHCEITFSFSINMAKPFAMGAKNFAALVPMYLSYHIGNETTGIIPINFSDFVDNGLVINEREIIEWKQELVISEGTSIPEVYYVSLLTEHPIHPGFFTSYPVDDYSNSDSFFPCYVFDHSFGNTVPPPGCLLEQTYFPQISRNLNFNCNACNFPPEPIDPNPVGEPYSPVEPGPIDPFGEGGDFPFHSSEENLRALQFQPNPFNNQLQLPFELKEAAAFELQIFDATGKVLHQEVGQRTAGSHQIDLDTDAWPAGLYYALVKTGAFSQSYRLVKTE